LKTSSPNKDNLIDLKDFIVEEVKKNAEQYIIDFGALIFKEKIGYGNSSEVFKGEWRGREVAIKKIKENMNSARSEKEFKREIMTSVRIRHHPQLVTLIGVS
jgi:predicted Ser/Thr protein kinase